MSRARQIRKPRRRIFLGCEGASERAYGQVIYDLANEASLSIHIDVVPLNPGAGDPLARIKKSIQIITKKMRDGIPFEQQFVLMDRDQANRDPVGAMSAERLANEHEILIIWQRPCHEALLLRHLPQCERLMPTTSVDAKRGLLRSWPNYQKPMTSVRLAERIGLPEVQRASAVEPELQAFLQRIGFPLA